MKEIYFMVNNEIKQGHTERLPEVIPSQTPTTAPGCVLLEYPKIQATNN